MPRQNFPSVPRRRRGPQTARVVGFFLLGVIAVTLFTAREHNPSVFPGAAGAEKVEIFLIDNGFHTDLAIPRQAFARRADTARQAVDAATSRPWVVVGWGDERFYTRSGFSGARMIDGLRSMFAPGNASSVRIEGLPDSPDHIYVRHAVVPISLTSVGLQRLEARIDQSLIRGPDGGPVPSAHVAAPDTAFFASTEHFSLIHLCNHWTADLLYAAGLPTTPVIDTVSAGLRLDLRARAGVADRP